MAGEELRNYLGIEQPKTRRPMTTAEREMVHDRLTGILRDSNDADARADALDLLSNSAWPSGSMAGVRSLLARVSRLERANSPAASPFVAAYGSFEAFVAWCEAEMTAGSLDSTDGRTLLAILARWDRDQVWSRWR